MSFYVGDDCRNCINWDPVWEEGSCKLTNLDEGHEKSKAVQDFIDQCLYETVHGRTEFDVSDCPGFVQNPWNNSPPPAPAHECDLCLGTGFVDDGECPECHGLGTYSFSA